jgi:hypothetical protein
MSPVLYPLSLFLLLCGFVCLIRPIIVVRLLYVWPKFIYPKLFRDKKILSKLEKSLNLLDKDQELYKDQNNSQIMIIRLTGIVSLLMFLVSLCMIFVKS